MVNSKTYTAKIEISQIAHREMLHPPRDLLFEKATRTEYERVARRHNRHDGGRAHDF